LSRAAERLAVEIGLHIYWNPKVMRDLDDLIAIDGYDMAFKSIRAAHKRGVGGVAAVAYALKVLAVARARRDSKKQTVSDQDIADLFEEKTDGDH
jgi:hypothetical protein